MFFSSSCSSKSEIYIPSNPAQLPLRNHTFGKGESKKLSLKTFVEERCPSLQKEYRAPWWLFNGHLQTLYCVLGDFTKTDKVVYNRTLIRTYNGGTLGLDFTPTKFAEMPEDTPIIVTMHGLTGGSYEQYVRAILYPACSPVEKGGLGYRGVVVNFRGCAGTPITSQQLYSAGYTDDIRTALMYIQNKYPKAPLLGLGFSLGANVITRYFSEEGEKSKMIAGCVLGCPWDLERNTDALYESFLGKYVYSKGMANNLVRLLSNHVPSLTGISTETSSATPPYHPRYTPDAAHCKLVADATNTIIGISNPTLEDFDNIFTRVAGGHPPVVPFKTARHYYEWARSDKTLPGVKRPLLTLNASDDPVVQHIPWGDKEVVGEEKEGYTVVVKTRGGGHLGWFVVGDDSVSRIKSENGEVTQIARWSTEPVLEWLQGMIEDVAYRVEPRRYYEDTEAPGWIREEGAREDLAYSVVQEGEGHVVDGTQVRKEQGMLQGL